MINHVLKSSSLVIICMLILGIMLVACEEDATRPSIPMGSLWYPVYGYDRGTGECQGGLGSAGWNDGGPPVMVEPWLGFYCFGDAAYREQTIALMREYGLSWAMISHNGWGDVDLDGDIEAEDFESAHRHIKATFEYLAGPMKGEFKAALLVEPYVDLGDLDPDDLTPEQKTLILDKIWDEIYQPHPNAVFHWDNKPLLAQWFRMDLGQDDRFTIRTFGSLPEPKPMLPSTGW